MSALDEETEPSEAWPELAAAAATATTLVLRKAERFAPHRFVDGGLATALPALTLLDVSGCGLERLALGALGALRFLDAGGNALGPHLAPVDALAGVGGLRTLDLSDNNLAALPAGLVALEALESLNASRNALTALALVDVAGCPRLRSCNVAGDSRRVQRHFNLFFWRRHVWVL